MTVNVELLQKTLAQIEAHPETWEQTDWRTETDCGSAYCFAGWAAVLSGAAFRRLPDGQLSTLRVIPPGGGDAEDVDVYAARVLGIEDTVVPPCDFPPLFHELNTLGDLRRMVVELITSGGAR